jgi:hypothetical protein
MMSSEKKTIVAARVAVNDQGQGNALAPRERIHPDQPA